MAWILPANVRAIDSPYEPTVGGLLLLLIRLVGLPAFAVAVNGSLLSALVRRHIRGELQRACPTTGQAPRSCGAACGVPMMV